MSAGSARRRSAARQAWALAGIALALAALLRAAAGPISQAQDYHLFADLRTCLGIPRAGDVLSNLAILAAGLWGLARWRRLHVDAAERPAAALLVAASIATGLGSAWYHWAPDDARLVWDRLPMAFIIVAALALVFADRVAPAFARAALLPFGLACAGGVLWWAGTGDLSLYVVVRLGSAALVAVLLVLRAGRHRGGAWLWAVLALELAMAAAEGMDRELFALSGALLSGHNLKHLLAGALLAGLFLWLERRRTAV